MITVEEIKQKALRRYEDYLRSIIVEDPLFFPLEIKGNKENEKDISILQQQQILLFENEKANKGFGYSLITKIKATNRGNLHTIVKIVFETELDYLKFLEKQSESQKFKTLLSSTLVEFPELKGLLDVNPGLLSENLDKWEDLLNVCRYFRENPAPGLYVRELAVSVHTKFIEKNKGILTILLSDIIPQHINKQGESFEDIFYLKTKRNLIRIRFLDSDLSPLPGFDEIGIAETDINTLSLSCKRVFIIENDIAALTFPKLPHSIILFGKGYNVASLKDIEWLKSVEIYYWGDMDVHGFEIMSQVRSYFSHVQSFLMDQETFENFKPDFETGKRNKTPTPVYLTHEEAKLYHIIREGNLRLEQEKISQTWVQSRVHSLLPSTKHGLSSLD